MTRKSLFLTVTAITLLVIVITASWRTMCSSTRIAFVNYQPISLGQIGKANDNTFIKIESLPVSNMSQADRYDMIFVNGMGLRITDEQRQHLRSHADNGGAVLSTFVTNPQNMIVSVDSIDAEFLKQYLQGGGRENYRSMLNYVRKFIDRKKLFVNEPKDPIASPTGLFYHPDVRNNANDELYFNTLAEYRKYLNDNGLIHDNAPEIILTGQMGVPDELVRQLEASGNIVYPTTSIQRAIDTGIADSISPSAMVNMAHGRMGDKVVKYLERMNIPLFAPLNVNRDYMEWMNDKMGMSGGFLSQSIVTPEIDGAIRPWALFAQYNGNDGVPEIKAIPSRLEEFVETVNRHIALRRKPNR
nr:cobaltochelatase subunit CobN [Bacteroidaceae bacterium]